MDLQLTNPKLIGPGFTATSPLNQRRVIINCCNLFFKNLCSHVHKSVFLELDLKHFLSPTL